MTNDIHPADPFDDRVPAPTPTVPILPSPATSNSEATKVEQSRAVAEVQAAVVVAHANPRNRERAIAHMRESCAFPRLAERAFFRFGRGGSQISGASVHLARELARCWGNISYGVAELERNDATGSSEMIAYAWDLETNARASTTFLVPHVRDTKHGRKPLIDVRDIYENNANMAARRLRECVFSVLPVWFTDEAKDICSETLRHGGGKPLDARIADCVQAFGGIGVDRQRLERKVGVDMTRWTDADVATLGVVFRSIRQSEATVADEFPTDDTTPSDGDKVSRLDAMENAVANSAQQKGGAAVVLARGTAVSRPAPADVSDPPSPAGSTHDKTSAAAADKPGKGDASTPSPGAPLSIDEAEAVLLDPHSGKTGEDALAAANAGRYHDHFNAADTVTKQWLHRNRVHEALKAISEAALLGSG